MKTLIIVVLCMIVIHCTYGQDMGYSQNPPPTISFISTSPSTCGASNGSITASGGNAYVWSNGAITATISGIKSGIYTVTVTNAAGCTSDSNFTLTDQGAPTITSNPINDTVCVGESFTLSVNATNTTAYQWKKDGAYLGNGKSSTYTIPSAKIEDGAVYTCIVYGGSCTATSSSALVKVNPLPTANAGLDREIKMDFGQTSATIGSSSAANRIYSWYPVYGLNDPTIANPTTSIANGLGLNSVTFYVLTVSDAITGCSATDQVKVSTSGAPLQASVSANPAIICNNGSAQLNVTAQYGSGSYSYSWNTGAATSLIDVSPAVTTTYTVIVSDGYSTTTETVVVTVASPPIANAGSDQTIQLGDTTNIGASSVAGNTYSWTSNPVGFTSTLSNPEIVPTISTNYTVAVTNASGCTDEDDVTINVYGGPLTFVSPATPVMSNIGQTINLGDVAQLSTLISGGTTGNYTYSWSSVPSGFTSTLANPMVSPSVNTTYSVIVSDGAESLNGTIAIKVIQPNPPTAVVSGSSNICLGDTATVTVRLTGASPWTLTYSDGTTPTTIANQIDSILTIKAVPTVAGSYVYSVTSVSNIHGTSLGNGYAQIIVSELPLASAGPDTSICLGGSITLRGLGGSTYSWSNLVNVSANTVSPTATTTYSVTVTDINSCKATDEVVVIVNALPISNAGVDVSICSGESVMLNATGGVSYSWTSNPAGFTSSISNPSVNPATNTGYTVEVIDINGCSATDYVVVNVTPKPTLSIANQTICAGQPAILNCIASVPSGSYAWSNDSTTQSISVYPSSTTAYQVIYKVGACTVAGGAIVTVNPLPEAYIGPDQTICAGNSVTLSNQSIQTYPSYLWSTGANTSSINAKPNTTTTYTLNVTDANNCSNADTVIVTVNSLPTITVSPTNKVLCEGDSVTLTASGGLSYNWGNGYLLSSMTVNPTTSTNYTVIGTSINGCANSKTVSVFVNAAPTANAGKDTTICIGSDHLLQATGGSTYKWSNGSIQATNLIIPTSTMNYLVTVTDVNGCSATDDVVVIVSEIPTVSINNKAVSICAAQSTTLNITSSGATMYNWIPATGLDNANISSPVATPTSNTTYNVIVRNAAGCQANDQMTVTVNQLPVITTTSKLYACEGNDLQITATSSIVGSSFDWSPSNGLSNANISSPVVNLTASTDYSLMVTSPQGCVSAKSVSVEVTNKPVSSFTSSLRWGAIIDLVNNSTDATSYLWDFGDGTTSTEVNPSHEYTANGNFNVWLTAYNSCDSSQVSQMVTNVTIGIEENSVEANRVSLYPNPVVDVMHLSGMDEVSNVKLVNGFGQTIFEEETTGQSNIDFNLSDIPAGIYFIYFTTEKGISFSKKMVKVQ